MLAKAIYALAVAFCGDGMWVDSSENNNRAVSVFFSVLRDVVVLAIGKRNFAKGLKRCASTGKTVAFKHFEE